MPTIGELIAAKAQRNGNTNPTSATAAVTNPVAIVAATEEKIQSPSAAPEHNGSAPETFEAKVEEAKRVYLEGNYQILETICNNRKGSSNAPDRLLVRIFLLNDEMAREVAQELDVRRLTTVNADHSLTDTDIPPQTTRRKDTTAIRIKVADVRRRDLDNYAAMRAEGLELVRKGIADTGQQVFGKRGIQTAVIHQAIQEISAVGWGLTEVKRIMEPEREPQLIPDLDAKFQGATKPNPKAGQVIPNRFRHSLLYVFEYGVTMKDEARGQLELLIGWLSIHWGYYCHVWTKNPAKAAPSPEGLATPRQDTINFRYEGMDVMRRRPETISVLRFDAKHIWWAEKLTLIA